MIIYTQENKNHPIAKAAIESGYTEFRFWYQKLRGYGWEMRKGWHFEAQRLREHGWTMDLLVEKIKKYSLK